MVDHEANGLLVKPRDPAALRDETLGLPADAGPRQRMEREGRRMVVDEFDIRVVAD